jgi:exosortase A
MLKSDESRLSFAFPFLVLAGFVLAYFPVLKDLIFTWSTSDDYSHGFFVVPIIGYILWQKKEQLAALPKKTSIAGLFLFILSLGIYLLSYYAEIRTVSSLSLVATLVGGVWFIYGPTVLKEVSFLLFFLLFMIPIPAQFYSAITIPLQLIVSKASVGMLSAAGVPIFRDGNVIHLPQHTFEVVQACSGLRSLITLLTLATIIAYFTLNSNVLRGVLVLSAVPTAIVVNIIRVMVMIVAYYLWEYDLTKGSIHTTTGVVIFVLSLVIIYCIRGVLTRWDR